MGRGYERNHAMLLSETACEEHVSHKSVLEEVQRQERSVDGLCYALDVGRMVESDGKTR